jgi:hypothetical protein
MWGALIGMIFLMPLAGAVIGAASGALGGALADVGINDQFMKDAAQHLQSGNAALFVLIRKMTTDKVLADLQGEGGTVVRTSFDETKEEALRTALAGATAFAAPSADQVTAFRQPGPNGIPSSSQTRKSTIQTTETATAYGSIIATTVPTPAFLS